MPSPASSHNHATSMLRYAENVNFQHFPRLNSKTFPAAPFFKDDVVFVFPRIITEFLNISDDYKPTARMGRFV